MKSTSVIKAPLSRLPILMQNRCGDIIMITDDTDYFNATGVVVKSVAIKLGTNISEWNMTDLVPFYGEVILSSE